MLKALVGAFNQDMGYGLSRSLLRDYEPSCGPLFQALLVICRREEGDTGLHAAVSHITATALALASSRQDLGGSLNLPPGVGFIIMIYIEV